jgi:PKD repeat protein
MKFTESSTCQAPISSWTWFFGDGTSARYTKPQPFIEHTYAVSGIFTVKMVAATQMVGGMITDTASSQVAVQPAAKASYKWQDVCIGNTTLFDNQTQDNNTIIKSYAWNFGDPTTLSDTSSARDVQYKYDLNGIYMVKLVVTNTLGCTDTIINKINIFKAPAADFSWRNNCAARPVSFTDQSEAASSDIETWNWQFSNGGEVLDKSAGQNSSYTFIHVGTYNAEMMVIDKNGCTDTIKKQVTISPNPVAAFTITENYENVEGQIMLSNGTIGGTNNYWDFGNGVTSYGENPVVNYNEEGHYDIKLLTWNDQLCTDTITLSYNLMYKGLFVPNAFDPGHKNPEVAIFKPKGLNLKTYQIEIYDSWGNLLWESDKLDEKGSPVEGWDGTYRGVLLQQDVYVWKIVAQYNDEQIWDGTNAGNNKNMPQTTAGTITLIR